MRQKSEAQAEETIVRPAGFSPVSSGMDIARPHIAKQKRRRRILFASGGVLALIVITVALSHLKPAVPSVDRSTVWVDTVKRGPIGARGARPWHARAGRDSLDSGKYRRPGGKDCRSSWNSGEGGHGDFGIVEPRVGASRTRCGIEIEGG